MSNVKLTQYASAFGWASKIGPKDLSQVLRQIPIRNDSRLLVGYDGSDDAAVYLIDESKAIIETLDFFTPIVDDPYTFGQIAATNALSDIYAMGGKPTIAMNIVCFPCVLSMQVLAEILKGGADKVHEAGAIVVGGHSIDDKEPKYGLSVTGEVHPDKIWKNQGVKAGDKLLISKRLGTGIMSTAYRGELLSDIQSGQVITSMSTLNKYAAEFLISNNINIHACTDITGFGLIGHLIEMLSKSNCFAKIYSQKLPLFDGIVDMVKMGIIPDGAYKNMKYMKSQVVEGESLENIMPILYDPQTSGGLLISVSSQDADKILSYSDGRSLFYSIGEICENKGISSNKIKVFVE